MSAEHSVHRPSSRRRRAIPAGLSAAALALAGLHAAPARADVRAYSTNTGPQLFGPAAAPVDLDTAAGAQDVLGFILPAPGFVVITFGAVCSVWGTAFQHGTIELRVDTGPAGAFLPVAPTGGTDDAFCSGNGVAQALDGRVAASVTVVARVPTAGGHLVQVLANTVAGATQLRLDDVSIVVGD